MFAIINILIQKHFYNYIYVNSLIIIFTNIYNLNIFYKYEDICKNVPVFVRLAEA